jgi:hypothetical protein
LETLEPLFLVFKVPKMGCQFLFSLRTKTSKFYIFLKNKKSKLQMIPNRPKLLNCSSQAILRVCERETQMIVTFTKHGEEI